MVAAGGDLRDGGLSELGETGVFGDTGVLGVCPDALEGVAAWRLGGVDGGGGADATLGVTLGVVLGAVATGGAGAATADGGSGGAAASGTGRAFAGGGAGAME